MRYWRDGDEKINVKCITPDNKEYLYCHLSNRFRYCVLGYTIYMSDFIYEVVEMTEDRKTVWLEPVK